MFDTVLGLPVHALVMHVVVVMVPLAAAGVIAIALVPRWRPRFGPLVIALSTIGLAAVPVATQSGQWLKGQLNASGVVAKQIDDHQRMGNLVLWPTLAMWVLVIALVLRDRQRRRNDRTVTIIAVLAVVAALAATAQVAVTGHLGSTAVWSCTIGSDACK
jgi:glucan phosphoethanolaminetransferase (alkaline phosphatase superfamily)